MTNYVIASSQKWFYEVPLLDSLKEYNFVYVSKRDDLTTDLLDRIKPRYIFFPHWNWIVPEEIHANYECVCFHTASLPFGRGGSPIQNQIAMGLENSQLCALRMTDLLDAGPVYDRINFSLLGGGDEIYLRLGENVHRLMLKIIQHEPTPLDQVGDAVTFRRRLPAQSELPRDGSVKSVFDHIRMLDAEGYPRAFIDHGNLRITISNPVLRSQQVEALVSIKVRER